MNQRLKVCYNRIVKEKGPSTLVEAIRYFSDEDVCVRTLAATRWPDGVIGCPSCGNTSHYYLASRRVWKCKACAKQFSIKVGTIMEDSPISLTKWLPAIWLITNAKNGISSYEIHRALGVTQKTAWFMLHRIRLALKQGTFDKLGGKNGPEVEVDETFIGGRARNMHVRSKIARNMTSAPMSNKEIVMGFLERDGDVRLFHINSTKRRDLEPMVKQNVYMDSWLYSDANPSYMMLGNLYRHETVDHAYEYVAGRVHTNGMENFWSLLKRTLRGTYVSVEAFHLFRYLDEQSFRFNERKSNDSERFNLALSQVGGKRVTYAQLTGKELVLEG